MREANAAQMRSVADSVRQANPDVKIVAMGDFNDDPTDESVLEVLGAKGDVDDLDDEDLFNPYYKMLKMGYGTLAYGDVWNLFDNIVVSENLVDGDGLQLLKSPTNKRVYGNIFKAPYLIQKEGKYRGYPFRSFSSGNFQGGYSDHLPVYIYLGK